MEIRPLSETPLQIFFVKIIFISKVIVIIIID